MQRAGFSTRSQDVANDPADMEKLMALYQEVRANGGFPNKQKPPASNLPVDQGIISGQTDMASVNELMEREHGHNMYHWFADSNFDAASKVLLLVLAIISGVVMWFPYGLSASGWTFISPVFGFIVPAFLTVGYLLVLLFTICDARFFNNNLRWILQSDLQPHYRIGDRWFNFFNGLIGILWNLTFFLLWLTFYLNHSAINTKAELLSAAAYTIEPYATLCGLGVIGYFLICASLIVALYANTATRENRDIMQRITRLYHNVSLEDVIMMYEKQTPAAQGQA